MTHTCTQPLKIDLHILHLLTYYCYDLQITRHPGLMMKAHQAVQPLLRMNTVMHQMWKPRRRWLTDLRRNWRRLSRVAKQQGLSTWRRGLDLLFPGWMLVQPLGGRHGARATGWSLTNPWSTGKVSRKHT